MKKEYNYFVALCQENTNDPMDISYTLYFINNSNKKINSLKVILDAKEKECQEFNSSDYLKEFYEVKPKTILELKYMDEADLGIDLHLNTLISDGKGCYERKVNINQVIFDENVGFEKIPIVNKLGRILCIA